MLRKCSIILSALLMLLFSCFALRAQTAGSDPFSLDEAIQYAYGNSLSLRAADLAIRDAEWRIQESKASGLPQLTAGINYQYFIQQPALPAEALGFDAPEGTKIAFQLRNNLGATAGVSQLLFSNSWIIALKAAKYYRQYVEIQRQTAKQKLRNQIIDAYLPTLLLTENLQTLDKNISNLESLLRETKAILEAGFAEQLDVDRLDLSLSNLRTERTNLVRQREIVVNALKMTMGYPIRDSITVQDNIENLLTTYSDADLTSDVNYSNRAEYLELLKGRELSVLEGSLYTRPYLPTVSTFVQYQPSYQGNDKLFWIPAAVAGVQLSVQLWDGGNAKAKRERNRIAIEQIDLQRKMLEDAIVLEVENARKQFLNARQRVANEQRNVELAQRIYNTSQTKYKAGVGSSLELVSAEQELYGAQQNLMQARYDLLSARAAVRRALGNNQ